MTDEQRRSTLFREVNERIRELAVRWEEPGLAGFFCECARPGCSEVLDLTVAHYDALRTGGSGFIVVRGHEVATTDQPVAPAPSRAVDHDIPRPIAPAI